MKKSDNIKANVIEKGIALVLSVTFPSYIPFQVLNENSKINVGVEKSRFGFNSSYIGLNRSHISGLLALTITILILTLKCFSKLAYQEDLLPKS